MSTIYQPLERKWNPGLINQCQISAEAPPSEGAEDPPTASEVILQSFLLNRSCFRTSSIDWMCRINGGTLSSSRILHIILEKRC